MRRALLLLPVLALLFAGCAADEVGDDATTPSSEGGSEEGSESNLTSGKSLRIMSYNIKYGQLVGLDLSKLAAVIKESNPDIIGLQEVDDGTRRSNQKKETDELATLTGMTHRFYGSAFDFDGGRYGLAILSKFPLSNTRVVRLDDRTRPENGFEPRISVVADVEVPGETIRFATLHASLHEEEHRLNGQRLLDALGDRKDQSIVVGDFNEKPGETIGDMLTGAGMTDAYNEKHRFFGFTSPAQFPIKRIDFIYRGRSFGKT